MRFDGDHPEEDNRVGSNRLSSGSDLVRRRPSSAVSSEVILEDVLMQILSLMRPKDAVKMSLVCRSWKLLVSDYHLWIYFLQNQEAPWDSVLFAETRLRFGHPIQTSPIETPQLSFMSIDSQRVQVLGSVIIDGGSGYCKFGWYPFLFVIMMVINHYDYTCIFLCH